MRKLKKDPDFFKISQVQIILLKNHFPVFPLINPTINETGFLCRLKKLCELINVLGFEESLFKYTKKVKNIYYILFKKI